MTTYFCEYEILPESNTRETCMTLFGGMSEDDDKKELGNVKLLGRWACVGELKGFCIAQSKNAIDLQKWLNVWVPMANIKVVPCLDDNEHRELLLGNKPPYSVSYDNISEGAKENETLYFIKYTFHAGKRDTGFEAFKNMTLEADKADSGVCTSYGRWHVPSQGCGFAVASSPSACDIYKWAYNWNSLCDCEIIPVTTDSETRKIIRERPGFDQKHSSIMKQLSGDKSCFSWLLGN